MPDLPTVILRLQALLDGMAGAIGPIMPPNDVKGERVKMWIAALSDVVCELKEAPPVGWARPQAPAIPPLMTRDDGGGTRTAEELDVLHDEGGDFSSHVDHDAATRPGRWTPTVPKRPRKPRPHTGGGGGVPDEGEA